MSKLQSLPKEVVGRDKSPSSISNQRTQQRNFTPNFKIKFCYLISPLAVVECCQVIKNMRRNIGPPRGPHFGLWQQQQLKFAFFFTASNNLGFWNKMFHNI